MTFFSNMTESPPYTLLDQIISHITSLVIQWYATKIVYGRHHLFKFLPFIFRTKIVRLKSFFFFYEISLISLERSYVTSKWDKYTFMESRVYSLLMRCLITPDFIYLVFLLPPLWQMRCHHQRGFGSMCLHV